VVMLRDLSEEMRREQSREAVLTKLSSDVHSPLLAMAHNAAGDRRPMGLFAREMTRHAVALQKLIVEMHELTAHLDSNTMARRQRPLTVDTLVWAVANEWKQVAQAANLALQVRIERHGMTILGDERRLRWALGNLVDNAIKYTPPGGILSLEVSSEVKGHTYIRVKDTGVGIAPGDVPKLFERFFRGTPMTRAGVTLQAPGSGQGLTIARQIIEAHGGQIRMKSVQYEGTSVYVSLPLTTATPQHAHTLLDMEGETIPLTAHLEARRAQ
jgi:two-component system, OmpR family, sensor histidine kinase BaeS